MTTATMLMTLTDALSDPDLRSTMAVDILAAIERAPLSEDHKALLRSGDLIAINAELMRERNYDRQQDAVEGYERADPLPPGWGPCWVLVG